MKVATICVLDRKNMSFDYVTKQPTLFMNNPQNELPVDNTIQKKIITMTFF